MNAVKTSLAGGFERILYESLGSTNDEAARLAREGAAEGTVVQALCQTGGRGRRGRAWSSPTGNLYATAILRPNVLAAAAANLSFVVALAAAEAVETALGDVSARVRCKWPNDLLVNGAKIVGILLESEIDANGRAAWVVAGTGINIASHPENTPYPSTSLCAWGGETRVDQVLQLYITALSRWYACWRKDGFQPIRAAWLARAAGLGQPITARLGGREMTGIFAGLDIDGVLLLDRDGERIRIAAGDVFFQTSQN